MVRDEFRTIVSQLLGLAIDEVMMQSDFVEDFEKWENEDLNAAELAYYIEVQSRVSQKLLEVVS